MPKWVADEKAKKKKEEEEKAAKKAQSSSVSGKAKGTFVGDTSVYENRPKGPSQEKAREVAERATQRSRRSTFMGGTETTPERRTTTTPSEAAQRATQRAQKSTFMGGTQTRTTSTQTKDTRAASDNAIQRSRKSTFMGGTETTPRRTQATEQRKELGQAMKSGDYERASRLSGTAKEISEHNAAQFNGRTAKPLSTRAKLEQWDRDIADTITHTVKQTGASDWRMLRQSAKGITDKDAFLYTTEEQRKRADEKFTKGDEELGKKIEAETKALEDIQKKHGYLGRQALSAVSSATGMGLDIAANTLMPGAGLGHMWMRSTGSSLGQVKNKADNLRKQLKSTGNYSDQELDEMFSNVDAMDIANAYASGGVEALSELIFRGFGPATKYLGNSSSIASKIASKLTGKVGSKASSGLFKNVIKGTAEEVAEEEIGGPLQALASNLIYGNKFQGYNEDAVKRSLMDQSNAIRSQIHSPEEAQQISARLSSDAFLQESINQYMQSGLSKDEATELANLSRDYLTASLSGDVDSMKKFQDAMVEKLTGGENSLKEKFTLQDAIDAAVSTSMMTVATGMPGALSTMQIGNAYKETAGLEAIKQQAEMIKNWGEPQESQKAQAVIDHIDSGGDLSGTQVYEIIQKSGELAEQNKEPEAVKLQMVDREMKKRDLRISPIGADGIPAPQTLQRFADIVDRTVARYATLDKIGAGSGYSTEEVAKGAEIGAAFETGIITSEHVNELVSSSDAVKAVFRDITGIDIAQFDSYTEMNKAIMAAAADNMLNSARLEQAAWNDQTRGEMLDYMGSSLGGQGDTAMQNVLEAVDPRDRTQFLMTADVATSLYDFARHTEGTWEEARDRYKNMYPSVNANALREVFDAAKIDKEIAETPNYGKVVRSGEKTTRSSLSNSETAYVPGKYIDNRQDKEGKSLKEESFLRSIATEFGMNVEVRDDLASVVKDREGNAVLDAEGNPLVRQDNGYYDPKTNTLVINAHPDATRTITQTAKHELTHHIKIYAPEEYTKLQKYIMDAWYRQDAAGFHREVGRIQALYKAQKNQDLSVEEALEELIADGAADFDWNDAQFIEGVVTNEPTLADRIIEAIKEVLRKIRNILASGNVIDEVSREALYDKAVEFSTTQSLWMNAAQAAKKDRANQAINEWQDAVNEQSDARYSVPEYTQEEMDAHRQELINDAVENYGEAWTEDYAESGYVFPNGKMLKMGAYGQRGEDHAMAGLAYDDVGYDTYFSPKAEAQKRFINEGNIRWMPENGWVNFGTKVEPTAEQYQWIEDAVYEHGIAMIEFTDDDNNTVDYKEYDVDTEDAYDVVNDIKRFYRNGKIGGSQLSQFRYSISTDDRQALNDEGIEELDDGTTARYSLTSWNETNKDKKLKALVAAGHDKDTAKKWIGDISSIASIIHDDPERLDYEADRSNKFLKPNGDYYKYTLDASTLCDKRRIYQGTYNAIQHMMPNTPLMQDDVVRIRTMLKDYDYKSPCGICYVESQRKNLGDYAKQWYDSYARKDEIKLEDVTTSDGLKALKESNPEVARDFEKAMAAKGVSSPKVVKLRTDYREDIMRMRPDTVKYLNSIGGLRFHSFSDFETPHLIDTMQAVMDMATKGLKGMAYAKVPNFAAVFGPTGIKINLSLIAKTDENGNAVHDENGRLVFDSVEGIPFEEANKWREAYPDDVAFILVGKDKQHTLEALKDDRVDFVIPFHRSKWSAEDMRRLGLVGYEDFATGHQENGVFVSEFWDYKKTGKQNAERYLEVCKEKGVTPVFEQLLHDNGDGTWSLQEDGSTDNYWKLIVEGKMYNHKTKKGAPQKVVKPNFNMDEARRILNEYEGGANTLPVAQDVAEAFVKEYLEAHPETEAVDLRYALPMRDADGNILTDGQMEYFKNSQARDSQGRLVPVYHGTQNGGFTIFDSRYGISSRYFFFVDRMSAAKGYSGSEEMFSESVAGEEDMRLNYKVYLDMVNPLIVDAQDNSWAHIPYEDDFVTTNWLAEYAESEGYDGVIVKNVIDRGSADTEYAPQTDYIVFRSNQIKDINNENPTENPDIRYSIASKDEVLGYTMQNAESITDIPLEDALLENNRVRYSLASTNFENSIISAWYTRTRNMAKDINETPLRRNLIRLMKQVREDSGTDRQYSTETLEETIRSIKKMYYYAKGDKAKDFAREAWDAAERIVGDINYDDVMYMQYKGISDYFAETEIHVPEELLEDDTFIQYAKNNAGRIRLFADEGIEIEDAWRSLNKAHPDLFPEAAFVKDSPIGMLIQMDWVLNKLEPYKEAYTSEEHSTLIEDIANNLCNIVDEGSEYYSTINELNVKAMRQRHAEAIRKVKEEEKQKRENQAERAEKWKQKYKERVEKSKADREAGKEKKTSAKLVGDIEKNIKWLSDRLRPETRTKDNAIPEQFRSALAGLLAEFDLQSKGSKKIEKKKGYPSKTTLKLKQLREQYAAIAKENDDDGNNVFRYNGDLLVKMDELIKTMEGLDKFFDKRYGREVTIADLSLSEMFIIDTMLKSLVHQFREYKNVTIDSKRAEIAGVSSEVIGDMDTQINRHGAAREGGALGKVSGLLNMSEVTPIYFFKRLGAMFKMYREVRKGFDKYIENDREVIKRLSEIMSGYYNKKNPGTTIESWRTMEDAQTFNFENGPITLSVAQMMEVYLYANRPQAFAHMIGDGIIVTPISPVGKIENAKEKLLGHEPMVDPVRLTYEDVQEIIATLSKEQINMADKLQNLVAGYMSDLGNETTMKLYGYKMFDDPNYFGIHVSQTAMNSSLDAPAITETIKNFGWTKPLTPGAKNTIVIGDIFTDVARYCNEMNQFNAYAVPVSDFMRVYNYKLRDENGELKGSAKSAIIKAFGKQAHTYIMNFMRDLNGASMRRNGGLEGLIDSALGKAKKAAVFMNMRVALQQPTAIARALAQINPKYFLGVRPSKAATLEMIEHCPIAQWKAWGFYDTHFGRDVEDLIMNNWSKADVVGSFLYGWLDNRTWSMIWQAVKKEVEDKQPVLKEQRGSKAYWEACNRRASEVFDSTQVVDSPFHRSDAMRSKDTLVKQFTSFQAEPTLSFNVVRDFVVQAYDAVADGDKGKAAKLISQGVAVWTLQAAVVAAAQSLWDAVRHKNPDGDDDEEEKFLRLWWANYMSDFVDDMKFYNNVYFIKEFTPYAEKLVEYMKTGKWSTYDNNKLLMFQGVENMAQGLMQIMKKIEKGDEYKHKNGEPYTWYEVMTSFLGGIGYLTGIPAGTVLRDARSIMKWFNVDVFAADTDLMDRVANKMGYKPMEGSSEKNVVSETTSEKKSVKEKKNKVADSDARLAEYREGLSDNLSDEQKDKLVKQYKKKLESESSAEIPEDFNVKEHAQEGVANFEYEMEKRSLKAAENAAGKTGNARNNALWDVISDGYTKSVESGNMATIYAMREAFVQNGGDVDWFDAKIADKMKSMYVKTINTEATPGASSRQDVMRNYMTQHGVTDAEISEIVRKSNTARDLKAALRMGNEQYILDELTPLIQAGLTYEDFEYLYKYRNYGAKQYDGKYTGPEYRASTGTFIWPVNGTITSKFGYRGYVTAGASTNHPAIDIGCPDGTPVAAADGGVVISAGWSGGYGNSVGIKHDNGMVTYYNHLSGWNVNVGDQVAQGQQIASSGNTGTSTGGHLDFKILDVNGDPVDPEQYLDTSNAVYDLDA